MIVEDRGIPSNRLGAFQLRTAQERLERLRSGVGGVSDVHGIELYLRDASGSLQAIGTTPDEYTTLVRALRWQRASRYLDQARREDGSPALVAWVRQELLAGSFSPEDIGTDEVELTRLGRGKLAACLVLRFAQRLMGRGGSSPNDLALFELWASHVEPDQLGVSADVLAGFARRMREGDRVVHPVSA